MDQEPGREPNELEQQAVTRRSRDTGGDAPAAASIEEREQLAREDGDESSHGSQGDDVAPRSGPG